MILPFDADAFFGVFGTYNLAIWPVQLIAYGLGALVVGSLRHPGPVADRIIATILALMWFWTGAVYHWLYFAAINRVALLFGAIFVAQGAILLLAGWRRRLAFRLTRSFRSTAGLALVTYATIFYPLIGLVSGQVWPNLPIFGVTPCPVAIFSFGCLLLTVGQVPRWVLVIPVTWSIVGGSAALLLNVPEDWILLMSGPASVVLLLLVKPRIQHSRCSGILPRVP